MTTLARCCVCGFIIFIHWCSTVSAQVVDIPDPNLEKAIRETLTLPAEISLTQQEIARLTKLEAGESNIADLTGLEHATNLKDFRVCKNQIHDLRPLSRLIQLEHLSLCANQISDISPLSNLTNLKKLDLGGNGEISDIAALENLTQLVLIFLRDNSIEDISTLANLTQLTILQLDKNQIQDISPLANLTLLEELWLNSNAITDITPLTKLKNLKKLYLADNPFHDFSPLLELEGVELDIEISEGFNVIVEVLDPNLRQLIRETLSLPEVVPLTQQQMQRLTILNAGGNRGITDLTGLEYATNIRSLLLYRNPIVDISPLVHLTRLQGVNFWECRVSDISPLAKLTNLTSLHLQVNQIADLSPLANLVNLQELWIQNNSVEDITTLANLTQLADLRLHANQIRDISPLAELINLTVLWVNNNQIVDFSPLANLVNLQELWIHHNFGTDFSPLQGLNLTNFRYDEVCDIEPLPPLVRERIENRSFPSVFQAWDDVVGLDHLTREQRNVLHDLHWFSWIPSTTLYWDTTATQSTYGLATSFAGDLAEAREIRQRRLAQNPNMIFLSEIRIFFHDMPEVFPPDSGFWFRDAQDEIFRGGNNELRINFLKPEVQDLLIKRIIAVERCGIFDGVMLDGFNNNGTGFSGKGYYSITDEEMIQAHLNIFQRVRAEVREDFLILINTNRSKATRFAEYVNGTFMETGADDLSGNPGGYTRDGLVEIEETLTWSEENFRSPQINCLEGWGIPTEPPDSPDNCRWMRVFTTMSLTLSDGYVMYNTGTGVFRLPDPPDYGWPREPGHEHIWYPLWDANLGRPVGPKAQQYRNIEGLFIRKFTNGWAVYNRSGSAQTIALPEAAAPVSDRGDNSASTTHILPDLDGEIYLTTRSFADVNSDGRVNILDLIQVANSLGKSAPDPNGDGVVNILDLVFVAQQFSQ